MFGVKAGIASSQASGSPTYHWVYIDETSIPDDYSPDIEIRDGDESSYLSARATLTNTYPPENNIGCLAAVESDDQTYFIFESQEE